ncbi:glutathione S-transferase 1-1 [Orussus abietinus]|uniref:glutathione S-transferase 1-1 n=1 Tax=Orussus abietinus TaxID=222816 RepID=UPI000626C76E|nr:glutathione S-transferase 1-1 [Orussus abietinus]
MTVDFYYLPPSPPCRAVMMLAKAVGVHLNLKTVDLLKGEHMTPEFAKMNPQHVIPTIDDNGFVLWESRPIMGYLVSKYAKNDALYPKDPKKKGIVDQKLFFDNGTLYERIMRCYGPILRGKSKEIQKADLEALENAFETLDTFLQDSRFAAGPDMTIADFSLVASVSTAEGFGFDVGRYEYVNTWYNLCKRAMQKFGYEEVNVAGGKILGDVFRANLE